MNTKPELDRPILRKNSLLFWCTLVIPVAIIALGINFLVNPAGASTAFGIAIHDPGAFPYMWTKGVRDIFAGLVLLPFLLNGDRRSVATIFAVSIFCPVWRRAHHPEASRFRIAHLHPLGNSALHDDRCRFPL